MLWLRKENSFLGVCSVMEIVKLLGTHQSCKYHSSRVHKYMHEFGVMLVFGTITLELSQTTTVNKVTASSRLQDPCSSPWILMFSSPTSCSLFAEWWEATIRASLAAARKDTSSVTMITTLWL